MVEKDQLRQRQSEGGVEGARRRWGYEPRVVKVGDLTDPQRRIVQAVADALRAENGR